jgi:hypothetical protein
MLTYKKSDAPREIVGYSDLDFVDCLDTEKSTSGYIFTFTNGVICNTPATMGLAIVTPGRHLGS